MAASLTVPHFAQGFQCVTKPALANGCSFPYIYRSGVVIEAQGKDWHGASLAKTRWNR